MLARLIIIWQPRHVMYCAAQHERVDAGEIRVRTDTFVAANTAAVLAAITAGADIVGPCCHHPVRFHRAAPDLRGHRG